MRYNHLVTAVKLARNGHEVTLTFLHYECALLTSKFALKLTLFSACYLSFNKSVLLVLILAE